jgi:hypothetical protein
MNILQILKNKHFRKRFRCEKLNLQGIKMKNPHF